jgi:hypothetical protein
MTVLAAKFPHPKPMLYTPHLQLCEMLYNDTHTQTVPSASTTQFDFSPATTSTTGVVNVFSSKLCQTSIAPGSSPLKFTLLPS